LAIGSLVASAAGILCCVGSIIGVVLGVIALNQIKQNQEGGQGLAIAGIVVGGVGLLLGLIFWAAFAGST
jgi:predicted acyltransferase